MFKKFIMNPYAAHVPVVYIMKLKSLLYGFCYNTVIIIRDGRTRKVKSDLLQRLKTLKPDNRYYLVD